MITFEIDGHVYEGPLPKGEVFLALYARAKVALKESGLVEEIRVRGAEGFASGATMLCAVEGAVYLFETTFKGWTVDGKKITRKSLVKLYATPERIGEPWSALAIAWSKMGFFYVPGTRSGLKKLEEAALAAEEGED